MKNVAILLFVNFCCVLGIKYDGLRVKFGWSSSLQDSEYFFKIPRTQIDAENEDWKRMDRPSGFMPEFRMYCSEDRHICPLYDAAGFVTGLQLALPVDEFESLAIKPEKRFIKWRPPTDGEPSKTYWTITQYYVSEESLKAGAGPQVENGETLQDGGVWVPGLDGRLMRIPSTEAELNTTTFKKQNCIPNMGTHYYYNMTRSMKCDDLLPWFALVSDGDLIGTGFQMFGRLARQNSKLPKYFEVTDYPKKSAQISIPYGPECLYDWADAYGVIGLHIYYVNEPWKIRCKDGDSIKPAPIMDRLLLNAVRYATQLTDSVSSVFRG